MTGGCPELVKEMIDIFISQIPEFCREMKWFYQKKDFTSLGLLAHKAKSSVAIMGMEELANGLKDFEQKAREGKDSTGYPAFIEHFENECIKAIEELNAIKNKSVKYPPHER